MAQLMADISKHNGKIDWSEVKARGIKGVIIRAGYGISFTEDVRFRENVRGAEANGLPWGVYCYSYATNMEEAKRECRGFLDAIKGLKPTLPVVIDTEDADGWRERNGNPSWSARAQMLKAQLEMIESAGYYAMYYCNLNWYRNMKDKADLSKYDLWLAHWGTSTPGAECGIWQYTSSGFKLGFKNGNGINTSDLNWCYLDYPTIIKNAGLNGWAKGSAATPQNPKPTESKKSVDVLAQEVLDGKWGNGAERKEKLRTAGYDAEAVQDAVNQKLGIATKAKTVDELATEVLNGIWGNGEDRKKRLEEAGYDADAVQKKVNEKLGIRKSIDEVAREVLNGKWGNGEERKRRLYEAGYDYDAVQERVNELC